MSTDFTSPLKNTQIEKQNFTALQIMFMESMKI